jgi:hypothetical protein
VKDEELNMMGVKIIKAILNYWVKSWKLIRKEEIMGGERSSRAVTAVCFLPK